ncbi:ComEA family DNA-binding protein [Paenibacillus kribbensis]|uniref:ComEA family DNA-binding protein n=1 Tax=Paenibacillus kribbensis TaxID=172713 RepID=UPI000838557D|nr:helix-hairpin-helix domain-containing protein [Paenibacillus kribbensis]
MKRVWTGTAITLAVIGSGLILFAGGQRTEPQEEWTLLNRKVEQVLASESEPKELQGNSDDASGKRATKANSDQTERSPDAQAAGTMKHSPVQGAAANVPAAVENSAIGNAGTVKQPDVANSSSDTEGVSSNGTVTNPATTSVSGEKKVNINTATAAELMELPGVGAKKAEAILDYRNQHGPFQRVNDLDHVKGIGAKMLAKMKPYVSL